MHTNQIFKGGNVFLIIVRFNVYSISHTTYYNNIINNSTVECFITLNKKMTNDVNKLKMLKALNTNISIELKKLTPEYNDNLYMLNNETPIFIKDKSIDGIEFDYPYEEKTLRDSYISHFASLILLFLSTPYIEEDSGNNTTELLLQSNNSSLHCKYYNLKFYLPKPDFTNLTPERALKIQKEIVKMVNDTDYTVTLEDIKHTYKEMYYDEIIKNYQPEINNQNLYQFGHNIFKLYEIIDSINTDDIKKYISKYIIQQEPIVRYNNLNI